MADVKFELNLPGLNELMKSPEMQAVLDEAGERVRQAAGDGYATSSRTGRFIGFCNIYPDDSKAAKDNSANNTLLKALSATGLRMSK